MKKIAAILLATMAPAPAHATQCHNIQCRPASIIRPVCHRTAFAHQVCCSWHSGVCGCSNGRALCCDGSASPSCGCN